MLLETGTVPSLQKDFVHLLERGLGLGLSYTP